MERKNCIYVNDIGDDLAISCKFLNNRHITWIDSSVDWPLPDDCPMKNKRFSCETPEMYDNHGNKRRYI